MVCFQIVGLILDMFGVYWMSRGLLLNDKTIGALSASDDAINRIQNGLPWSNNKNLTLEAELLKNRRLAKQGLFIIGLGFSLQLISVVVPILNNQAP